MLKIPSLLAVLALAGTARAAPPVEVTQMLKSMAGTWRCTGTAPGPDGADLPLAGTWKTTAELDGAWARDAFDGMLGKGKTATRLRLEVFTTYDPATRKWRELAIDGAGASYLAHSDGMRDLKMELAGDAEDDHGAAQLRGQLDMSNLKTGAHRRVEVSRDRGRTWTPIYDLVCKR